MGLTGSVLGNGMTADGLGLGVGDGAGFPTGTGIGRTGSGMGDTGVWAQAPQAGFTASTAAKTKARRQRSR